MYVVQGVVIGLLLDGYVVGGQGCGFVGVDVVVGYVYVELCGFELGSDQFYFDQFELCQQVLCQCVFIVGYYDYVIVLGLMVMQCEQCIVLELVWVVYQL